MPDTLEALIALTIGLLPGALYTWAFEREAGAWGTRFTDRALRFVGISAIVHALFAPATYLVWVAWVRTGRVAAAQAPLALWLVLVAYVALPLASGTIVGRGTRKRRAWARIFTGPNAAPRAWDHLFAHAPDGWIRLRMKSGVWLSGAFATQTGGGARSYATGYPDEQDLYLVQAVDVDPQTGEFLTDAEGHPVLTDAEGHPVLRGSGILVRWEEVEYLEFIEA